MTRRCLIPSNRMGECDLAWGHEGRMHSNAGDGFYVRDFEAEHAKRQVEMSETEGRVLLNPNAMPLPMTANLVAVDYKPVNTLTLPDMSWPPYIRWHGRIFALYHETRALPTSEDVSRKQVYREIEIWDVP